ncbi:hypothetical protein Vadar_004250 [Vaccinium darrowii]|uniref:Uncharacterized protein n=1 Tax=Vaccinium darrowii TaxID=229202 RepID=A0ACB7X7J0_9ERIC|nr:hypothetical protein Vadar_004250 [Vaccinium darrowii]
MAELSVFEKAKKELEDFYLGVSEESKELSFKDLVQAKQQEASPLDEKKECGPLDPASETNPSKQEDFYLGVSEELLELSFKDLVRAKQQGAGPSDEKKKPDPLDPTSDTNPRKQEQSSEFYYVGNNSNRGVWESLLQAMCARRDGRDDGRKQVYRMLRKEDSTKGTYKEQDRERVVRSMFMFPCMDHGDAARAQAGRKRAQEERRE